jgi:hypothetical protein
MAAIVWQRKEKPGFFGKNIVADVQRILMKAGSSSPTLADCDDLSR